MAPVVTVGIGRVAEDFRGAADDGEPRHRREGVGRGTRSVRRRPFSHAAAAAGHQSKEKRLRRGAQRARRRVGPEPDTPRRLPGVQPVSPGRAARHLHGSDGLQGGAARRCAAPCGTGNGCRACSTCDRPKRIGRACTALRDVSLLAASATMGSAFEDGGSWMLGARHTYADVIANLIKRNSLPYGFSDAQGHLSRPVFGGAVLSVTGYSGSDGAMVNQASDGLNVSWGNRLIGATLSKMIPEHNVVLGLFPADSASLVQRASLTTFGAAAAMGPASASSISGTTCATCGRRARSRCIRRPVDHSVGYEISAQLHHLFDARADHEHHELPAAGVARPVADAGERLVRRPLARVAVAADRRRRGVRGRRERRRMGRSVPRASRAKYFITQNVAVVAATGAYAQWLHSLLQEDAPVQPLESGSREATAPCRCRARGSRRSARRRGQPPRDNFGWKRSTRSIRTFPKQTRPPMRPAEAARSSSSLRNFVWRRPVAASARHGGRFGWWIAYSYAVSTRLTPAGVAFSPRAGSQARTQRRGDVESAGAKHGERAALPRDRHSVHSGRRRVHARTIRSARQWLRAGHRRRRRAVSPGPDEQRTPPVRESARPEHHARRQREARAVLSVSEHRERVRREQPAFYVFDYNHVQNWRHAGASRRAATDIVRKPPVPAHDPGPRSDWGGCPSRRRCSRRSAPGRAFTRTPLEIRSTTIVVHAVLNALDDDQVVVVQETANGIPSLTSPVDSATVTITGPDGVAMPGVEVPDSAFTRVYHVSLPANHEQLVPGGTYRLQVKLKTGEVITGATTVPDASPVLPPVAMIPFNPATDTFRLSWPRVAGASSYEVRVQSFRGRVRALLPTRALRCRARCNRSRGRTCSSAPGSNTR